MYTTFSCQKCIWSSSKNGLQPNVLWLYQNPSYIHYVISQDKHSVSSPAHQWRFQAVVCVSIPRMYLQRGFFLVLDKVTFLIAPYWGGGCSGLCFGSGTRSCVVDLTNVKFSHFYHASWDDDGKLFMALVEISLVTKGSETQSGLFCLCQTHFENSCFQTRYFKNICFYSLE